MASLLFSSSSRHGAGPAPTEDASRSLFRDPGGAEASSAGNSPVFQPIFKDFLSLSALRSASPDGPGPRVSPGCTGITTAEGETDTARHGQIRRRLPDAEAQKALPL